MQALLLFTSQKGLQLLWIDPRHGDMSPDAVDHKRQQQKDQPATQIAELA